MPTIWCVASVPERSAALVTTAVHLRLQADARLALYV